MKNFSALLAILIVSVAVNECVATPASIAKTRQTLKEYIRPIIDGNNAYVSAVLNMTVGSSESQDNSIWTFEFWTRRSSHNQWAVSLQKMLPTGEQVVYKSLFTDNRLYRSNELTDQPKLAILEHLLVNGLQMSWSQVDKVQHTKTVSMKFYDQTVVYDELTNLALGIGALVAVKRGNHPIIENIRYFKYDRTTDQKVDLSAFNIEIKTFDHLDDQLFKLTEDEHYRLSFDDNTLKSKTPKKSSLNTKKINFDLTKNFD